ncbi:MAG: RluA family pseudouridine synthase [Candidatus Nealsonbacteria bacterium]|nr:RluA family pseudouridine synthase [Candidatus Nealsonbacteria bacterium]
MPKISNGAGMEVIGKENKFSSSSFAMTRIYQDENVKVIDKPAGISIEEFEKPAHRLDKDTSGVLLLAKDDKTLDFLQKQFKERKVQKKYIALVVGHLKLENGEIETLLGRAPGDRRKQKVYFPGDPKEEGKRTAITKYKVLQRYEKYDLIEAEPQTGRKHQIRVHLASLGHPIAGDKLYGFKNQPCPKGLLRQFLHSSFLKIELPSGEIKEFTSELPKELETKLPQKRK